MLRHYGYRVLALLRDRGLIFWILMFPLLMGTLFNFTFGALLHEDKMPEPIKAALIAPEKGSENQMFRSMLNVLAEGDSPLIEFDIVSEETAMQLLKSGEVSGVFTLMPRTETSDAYEEILQKNRNIISYAERESETSLSITAGARDNFFAQYASALEIPGVPCLTVTKNGIEQSVLKMILDRYVQSEACFLEIAIKNPSSLEKATQAFTSVEVERVNLGVSEDSVYRENFYALIAMTCLYGSFVGLSCTESLQPDISYLGVRRSISPTPKIKQVFTDTLAALTVLYTVVLIVLFYLSVVLNISFGKNIGAICASSFVGSLVSVFLGMFIGVAVKGSHKKKEGVLVCVSMTLSVLSGLVYPLLRNLVAQVCPLLNIINPAALLVDSFYTLDMYGLGSRYFFDLLGLGIIAILLFALSSLASSRRKYAHI